MSAFPNWSQIVHNGYIDKNYDPTILDTYDIEFPEFKNGSQLEIIDTSGSGPESYDSLADQYIREAEVVLLFYSTTSDSSFRKILDYYARVQSLARNPAVMLIGTKCDVDEREVPSEKGRRLARKMGVYFQEISAKKGTNTERVFSDLKHLLLWRHPYPGHRTPLKWWGSTLIDMTRLICNASSALLTSKFRRKRYLQVCFVRSWLRGLTDSLRGRGGSRVVLWGGFRKLRRRDPGVVAINICMNIRNR
jgi:small GTP-binding protein